MLGTLDLNVIGLAFNIAGIFFLASSIKFKRSRRVLQEYFGVEKQGPLKNIREHVVRKIQVHLGFLFLVLGYGIQIAAITSDEKFVAETSVIPKDLLIIAAILVLMVLVVTVVLKLVQIAWIRVTFKSLLIDFFREHEWELVRNTNIAKEMGELLKIPRNKDDSIEEYIMKIKCALHIEDTPEGAPATSRRERAELGLKTVKMAGSQVHRATPPRIE